MFDSHCHLDVAEFDADRAQVLANARHAGVHSQLIPAIQAASWQTIQLLCEHNVGLYPAYGLHPLYQAQHRSHDLPALRQWLRENPAAAVGEFGLDFFEGSTEHTAQQVFFHEQLKIARSIKCWLACANSASKKVCCTVFPAANSKPMR
jgi:TatD DNase family protein